MAIPNRHEIQCSGNPHTGNRYRRCHKGIRWADWFDPSNNPDRQLLPGYYIHLRHLNCNTNRPPYWTPNYRFLNRQIDPPDFHSNWTLNRCLTNLHTGNRQRPSADGRLRPAHLPMRALMQAGWSFFAVYCVLGPRLIQAD